MFMFTKTHTYSRYAKHASLLAATVAIPLAALFQAGPVLAQSSSHAHHATSEPRLPAPTVEAAAREEAALTLLDEIDVVGHSDVMSLVPSAYHVPQTDIQASRLSGNDTARLSSAFPALPSRPAAGCRRCPSSTAWPAIVS